MVRSCNKDKRGGNKKTTKNKKKGYKYKKRNRKSKCAKLLQSCRQRKISGPKKVVQGTVNTDEQNETPAAKVRTLCVNIIGIGIEGLPISHVNHL